MKKIIVPVDFSKYSKHALKVAALFAKNFNAEVYALHMLDTQDFSSSDSENYHVEKSIFTLKLAEKRMKYFLDEAYLKDVKLLPIINHFKGFSEINSIVKESNADLIIMGSHGASGVMELFVGSNTEKVIRYSNIPVLVIKNELNNINFNDIVIATDFSKETIPAFQKLLKTLEFSNAKKHLLYVNTPTENFRTSSEMDALAHNFLMKTEGNTDRLIMTNFVSDRTIEEGILNFSNVVGADLIAVLTHGRKGLSHVFSGSISEDISNHSSLPVLTLKR